MVPFTGIQYCASYQNHKVYCHVMISGENLLFCAADSNMYIGWVRPYFYGSSYFLHIPINQKFLFQLNVKVLTPLYFSVTTPHSPELIYL